MANGLETWLSILAIITSAAAAIIIILATQRRGIFKNLLLREGLRKEEPGEGPEPTPPLPVKVELTVTPEEAERAREDLRILNLEKEITSFALTRLYEAEAEGKITQEDRAKLLGKYKSEMQRIDQQISRKETVVKLRALEVTQADFVKLFSEKFDQLTRTVESMRASLGTRPQEVAQAEPQPVKPTPPRPAPAKEAEKPPPRPRVPRSEAEGKIEAIQEEVLKVLERLEQIEVEG